MYVSGGMSKIKVCMCTIFRDVYIIRYIGVIEYIVDAYILYMWIIIMVIMMH